MRRAIEDRRQIGAAAKPGFRRDDEPGVHMYGGDMRIARMGDQRNAGGPEARIGLGAGDLSAEFGRELAVYGRDMHAGLLEKPSMQHRHDAATAFAAIVARALPRRALEPAGPGIGHRTGAGFILKPFEFGANVVAQRREPDTSLGLFAFQFRRVARIRGGVLGGSCDHACGVPLGGATSMSKCPVCLRASPSTMARATATFSERNPVLIGTLRRASAASCTSAGTPALSLPARRMSPST